MKQELWLDRGRNFFKIQTLMTAGREMNIMTVETDDILCKISDICKNDRPTTALLGYIFDKIT